MAGKYLTRTIKTTLIAVFTFQLLSTVERQVFDFLGYMWAPIIGNFFQIIAVILGLFGACQHYRSFVVVYATWSLLWLGWNIFVICLYLEVGILNRNRERYILTIGTESKSWWLEHGIGCIITNNTWVSPQRSVETSRPIPPEEFVQGCILQYYYVEVIHAAVQVLLSVVGLVVSFIIIYNYLEEEDASSPANDELEFVKIRRRAPTTNTIESNNRATTSLTRTNFDNMAFENETLNDDSNDSLRRAYRLPPPGPRQYEQPPSYDTTMRNANMEAETRAANQYYSDRQSVRSKASTRSKRSTTAHHRGGNQASSRSRRSVRERDRDREQGATRQDLPWVQITPSASGSMVDGHTRHY
ncbi:sodium/potassium-transporting ATPase subunit beta-1-interacting protein-like [Littorina saxatilis]|uniref:Sodium/potassium-transporting ATPase subunit beta-1-interacting protein n=1 Tax=Littorina saxatilis TaxID=31220 RepID=A0AAN9G1W9_9CAEN